jgi:hypothetical protein
MDPMDRFERLARLSPERRKLFELMLDASASLEETRAILGSQRSSGPLSSSQERLWFLAQFEPESSAYNLPVAVQLSGPLDAEALRRSLEAVVCRHEVLRTRYQEREGILEQIIEPAWNARLESADLSNMDPVACSEQLAALLSQDAATPFDLAQGPVFRVRIIKLAEQEHVLSVTMHHIASDGWSIEVLFRDVTTIYEALANRRNPAIPPLLIQYADYALWQKQWLHSSVFQEHLAYLRKQLATLPAQELPTDRQRSKTHHSAGLYSFDFGSELSDAVIRLTKQHQVTLFMGLLAALNLLLHYWTRQTDVVVGTDVANRNRPETENLIGFFINQLVLRTDLSGDPTFVTILDRVRDVCLNAYDRQDVPFDRLVEALNPNRSSWHPPLFRVKLVLQNTPETTAGFSKLRVARLHIPPRTTKFDLTLTFSQGVDNLLGSVEYSADLFERETIVRLEWLLRALLSEAALRPRARLADMVRAVQQQENNWRRKRAQELQKVRQRKFDILARCTTEAPVETTSLGLATGKRT